MPFPLFQSHLELAHQYWKRLIIPGDSVIDATSGNGHDALFLATLALTENSGHLYCLDLQTEALENTRLRLQDHLPPAYFKRMQFISGCHSSFPEEIQPNSIKLIVYNLGYLPGGNKAVTTQAETTLKSIEKATDLIAPQGVISIMCYPGHPEGKIEEAHILSWLSTLDRWEWSCCHHRWINKIDAPSLIILQKS